MKNEYFERDQRNRISDGEPRALYWYPYRETFEKLKNILVKGEIIPRNIPVIMLANNSLKPQDFDLRKVDRQPVGSMVYPGKSVHVKFTSNIHIASGAIMDRDAKRQDCLYAVDDHGRLEEIGYYLFYCPLPNQPLHARLVHCDHIENIGLDQVPIKYRVKVAQLFGESKFRCK